MWDVEYAVLPSEFHERYLPKLLYIEHRKGRIRPRYLHRHSDSCEMLYVQSGCGSLMIDGIICRVSAGDLAIFNKDVIHSETFDDIPCETYLIGMSGVLQYGLEENQIIPMGIFPVIKESRFSASFEGYIHTIYKTCSQMERNYEQICQGLLLTMFALLSKDEKILRNPSQEQLLAYQIKSHIDEHYTQELKLQELAKTFYISEYYLCHLFKKTYGLSPIRYVMSLRIGEAQRLLQMTSLPVREISQAVGYDNTNYFATLFRRYNQMTPSVYREESTLQHCVAEQKRILISE